MKFCYVLFFFFLAFEFWNRFYKKIIPLFFLFSVGSYWRGIICFKMEQRRTGNFRFFSLCSILALKYSKVLLHICMLAISLKITTSNCMSLFDLKNWSFFSTLELCLIWRPRASFDVKMNLNFVKFEEEHVIFPLFEKKIELVLIIWICFEFEKEFEFCLVWRRPCTCSQHLIEL